MRRLLLLGTVALVALSVACHVDMLLKPKSTPPAVLTVAPTEVHDSARAGSTTVRNAEVAITSSGGGKFTWSATDQSSWINLSPRDGDVPDTLTISLDPRNLAPGTYESDVTITATGAADTQFTTIPVTFLVQRPGLTVSPLSIERSTNLNSNATFTETLQISNSGTGELSWTATKQQDWLTLGASSGTGNGTIPVTINSSGLSAGTYRDDIVITAPGAIGSPVRVGVTLNVFAPGLAVSPGFVADTAIVGATTPESQTLHVTNSGTGSMTWNATKTQPWVTLSKASGGAPEDLSVTMDPTGLPTGVQRDTIVFTSAEATTGPVKVPVDFEIIQPGLVVAPPSITAIAEWNDLRKQHFDLAVSNSGGGAFGWMASADQLWITVSPPAGLTPSTLTVTLDPQGLGAGPHSGTVTVTSPGADGSPFTVPVQLTITSRPCNEISISPDVIRAGTLDANDCEAPHRPGSLANLYSLSANAADTLSMRLVSQDFNSYLILTDGAGNVLAENDECLGETGTACIMEFPIAVTGRYLIEATSTAPGVMGALTISVVRERAPTPPLNLGQFRVDGSTSIGIGTSIPETEVVIKGKVDDPNQSDVVRFEVELKPLDGPFTGVPTQVSDFVARGTATAIRAGSLTNNTGYHWQARTCDQGGRCSAWLQFGNNTEGDADFVVAVPPPGGSSQRP